MKKASKQTKKIVKQFNMKPSKLKETKKVSEEEFTILTIDSCEYLLAGYDRSRMITHKGNCKFCAERSKK